MTGDTHVLELVILIGLQASGKTTFRRDRLDATHSVVSKDLLRNNRRPARRQEALITNALAEGRSVVVDNTNVRYEDRAALIGLAQRFNARVIGYYFPCTVSESLARNSRREGRERVPDVGIFSMAKVMHPPAGPEGFDELYRVRVTDAGGMTMERMDADEA